MFNELFNSAVEIDCKPDTEKKKNTLYLNQTIFFF